MLIDSTRLRWLCTLVCFADAFTVTAGLMLLAVFTDDFAEAFSRSWLGRGLIVVGVAACVGALLLPG